MTLPPWIHALVAMAMVATTFLVGWGCWALAESPRVRHFFHGGLDPLCNRCHRARALRWERERHQQMIRELRKRHG